MTVTEQSLPIAANLITGFLGSGKTSAILSLLLQRPAHERWAVLVNEYGMVSLDHILLNDGVDRDGIEKLDVGETGRVNPSGAESSVMIDEMAGGCFCCTLADSLPSTLNRLLRQARPHRLLIEPTGAGHPAAVIDLLRTGSFSSRIDLRATICLVDPRDCENPRVTSREVFQDQIQMADIVAINFADKCSAAQIDRCRDFVHGQEPPKLLVQVTTMGKLNVDWLDYSGIVVRDPLFPEVHEIQDRHHQKNGQKPPGVVHGHVKTPPAHMQPSAPDSLADTEAVTDAAGRSTLSTPGIEVPPVLSLSGQLQPGEPRRYLNHGLGQIGCGWIFHSQDVFDRQRLTEMLNALLPLMRLKGVFHCQDDWWSIQGRGSDLQNRRSAYRRDSRVECIATAQSIDWTAIELQLLACLSEPAA